MDFQKKRFQLLGFIIVMIALSFTAEKFREIVGETGSSQSGKFTIFNCLDGGSGTVACLVKEGVKLYTYNIRTVHVEVARNKAIEASLADAISQGMEPRAAAKKAQQDGAKAAKQATRKAKRIVGPIISSGWDFFEALYYGGTVTEGFLRGTGTLFGTYFIGYLGEERFGRLGYLVGSQFGSWIGGRMGLMVYDIGNGVHFLLQFGQPEENVGEKVDFSEVGQTEENVGEQIDYGAYIRDTIMSYVGSYMSETSTDVSSEAVEEVETYEPPVYESFESNEEL
ncbi:hypothetical protein L1987_32083 [Smallanthus sonchifolius]|uniref:Uncharacterized protein n=1 Tax=Smallanthus sonchifolius TaxID=185202 RepID=A0ACB9I6P0_9ASTR|nr:hypothetical protein L1987_32083 [Smallanthus sonchifolius]